MTTSAAVEPTQHLVRFETPFTDQNPAPSIAQSSRQFEEPCYLESFIEASLRTLPGVQGGTLVLGGDGRYGNRRAIDVILRMGGPWSGQGDRHHRRHPFHPAASNLIRKRQAIGGIILSASHNPGGPKGDFGVKVNGANGGPTPASLPMRCSECTTTLISTPSSMPRRFLSMFLVSTAC